MMYKIRATPQITAIFTALLLIGGCSPKLRYPLEEIKRPISMPAKNWGLSLGLGPGYYHQSDTSYYCLAVGGNLPNGYNPVVGYPFLPIFKDKVELHFTLLNIKFYPVRHTKIEDSTICIDGFNWAIGGGINGIDIIFYNNIPFHTTSIPLNVFSEMKAPITTDKWLFSEADFSYNPNPAIDYYNRIDAHLNFGIGMQFNRNLYSTIALSGSYMKKTRTLEMPLGKSRNTILEECQLFFPIHIGYNITNRWKIFLFGAARGRVAKDVGCYKKFQKNRKRLRQIEKTLNEQLDRLKKLLIKPRD